MSVHRGVVSAVGPSGLFVRVAEFGPSALPASLVGPLPSLGASVVVLDAGDEGAPDLVVVTDLALGGTVLRPLAVVPVSGHGRIDLVSPSVGSAAALWLSRGSYVRWFMGMESASAANWLLWRYSPTGASLGAAVTVDASTGRVSLGRQTVTADGAETVVTKGFVDAIKSALAASSDFADFKARVAAL